MDSTNITLIIIFILFLVLLGATIYSYYKIDKLRLDVETHIQELHGRFSKIINAINAINYSEFEFDMKQQKQIDKVLVEK